MPTKNWLPDFTNLPPEKTEQLKRVEARIQEARNDAGIISANYRYSTDDIPPYSSDDSNFNETWDWMLHWFNNRKQLLSKMNHLPNWKNLKNTLVFYEGTNPKILNAKHINQANNKIYKEYLDYTNKILDKQKTGEFFLCAYTVDNPGIKLSRYTLLRNLYDEKDGEHNDRMTSLIHENTHQLFHQNNNPNIDINRIKLELDKREDFDPSYTDTPQEIYSRLMEARWGLNLKPTDKITRKQIRNWKNRNVDFYESKDSGILQNITLPTLIDRYDEDTLLYLFNEVARNDSRFKKSNMYYAKQGGTMNYLDFFKKGGKPKIHIKESQKGSFTRYCKGKVTNECIQRGKNSPDPRIRKKATFALNVRAWKHQSGGELINPTKGTFYSRTKVETPEQKKYTVYIPEDNTSSYQRETTSSSTSYDLSGYTLPTVTITTSTASKSDNKLHADINGLLDLFNKYNVHVRVTSGYREGATTSNGSQSHHATGRAIDVVPEDGDFAKLAQVIKNTPEIRDYMISKGLGILDETTKEMLARTGGSGAHYHIGPDKIAQNFWTTLT